MSPQLPQPLPDYFEAQNAHAIDAMLAAFSDHASVRDEGKDLSGHAAIRAWLEGTSRKYRVTVTPLAVARAGAETVVTVKVAGTFPGSPIELSYRFTIEADKIVRLAIG